MSPGADEMILRAERPVAGGEALARDAEGRVVLIEGALPGERVRVDVTRRRRDLLRASVREVLDASPERIEPPCPALARGCGGCDLQHLAPAAQPAFKGAIVADALHRIGRLEDPPVTVGPALPAVGYRTTVRVAVSSGEPGFRARASHRVVPVRSCLVAHPALDELLASVRFGPRSTEATFRVGPATGRRAVVVDPSAADVEGLPTDVEVVGRDELRAGSREVFVSDVVAGVPLRIGVGSFFQSRSDGAAVLVDEVRRASGDLLAAGVRIVDAYAGVGLFSATVAPPEAGSVTALEWSRSSVADARHNLRDRFERCSPVVRRTDVARWTPTAADLMVADPARTGLGRGAVEVLAGTGARRLVLVSCDAASLGRDTALLADAGFALVEATVVDLFPQTHHLEVVSRFDRVSG